MTARWRMLRSERASAGNDGVGRGCTTTIGLVQRLSSATTPAEKVAAAVGVIELRRGQANGGAQCGKSARCVRRGGDWKRGMVEMLGHSQTKGRDNREPKPRPTPAPLGGPQGLRRRGEPTGGGGVDERGQHLADPGVMASSQAISASSSSAGSIRVRSIGARVRVSKPSVSRSPPVAAGCPAQGFRCGCRSAPSL